VVFEAYYKKSKLAMLVLLGMIFVLLGMWMARRAHGAFDDDRKIHDLASLLGIGPDAAGHGIGWFCAALGLAAVIAFVRRMTLAEPVIRVDGAGIHYHHWSPKPIGWDNVEAIRPYALRRTKFVGIRLRDLSRDPPTGFLRHLAKLNAATGFGHVSLPLQATDRTQEELLEAIRHHAAAHEQARRTPPPAPLPSSSPAPRTFGRRGL